MSQETAAVLDRSLDVAPVATQGAALGTAALEETLGLEAGLQGALSGEQATEEGASEEKYALSFCKMERFIGRIGACALAEGIDTEESVRLKEILKDEWKSSIVEMLATDPDFRRALNIRRIRSYDIVGDKIMAEGPEGQEPIVDMVRRGADRSRQEATVKDRRMWFQARRDRHDLLNAQEVDELAPGMMRVVVSMDPKEAFRMYGRKFVERLGYREGWGSIQGYFKLPDGSGLQALTFTFNHSDVAVMGRVLNSRGAEIPVNVTADDFIQYALTIPCEDLDQARDFMSTICAESYGEQGITNRPQDVGEFLDSNPVVDQIFESQYVALALAHHSKNKNDVIHTFAKEMLNGAQNLNAAARERLVGICVRQDMERGDTEIMDYLIRYGVVELLRRRLPNLLSGGSVTVERFVAQQGISTDELIARGIAGFAKIGIANGRTYGGCTAEIDITDEKKVPGEISSPQDAFGGKDESGDRSKWVWKRGVCRIPNCPTRPGATRVGPCEVCRGCQRKFDSGVDPAMLYTKRKMFKHKTTGTNRKTVWPGEKRTQEKTPQ